MPENFAARLKQADLVKKTNFDNKLTRFKNKLLQIKQNIQKLKKKIKKKINSLITKDYNLFFGRIYFTSNDVFQKTFIYQPTFDTLELKKVLIMFVVGNQREYIILNLNHYVYCLYYIVHIVYIVYILYTLHSIKRSEYRIVITFDKDPLAVEQNNYLTKIVIIYTLFDLDDQQKSPTNNFKFKNCLFGATNIVKNSHKEKYVSNEYGITFDTAGSWHFGNNFVRSVVIFGIDNSSSSHADNRQNNFLVLGDDQTYGINGGFGSPEKSLVLILLKQTQNFVPVHYNADHSYLLVNKKGIFKFKACVHYFHHIFIFSPNDSPSKTLKNAFYFI